MNEPEPSTAEKAKRPLWVRALLWVIGVPVGAAVLWWLFEYQVPKFLPVNF